MTNIYSSARLLGELYVHVINHNEYFILQKYEDIILALN